MADILQGGNRDTVTTDSGGAIGKFEVTNFTEDYSFNANVNDTLVTSDVLATLIRELIQRGVINGTVA
ncbi:MAG: hypothetical protein DRR06_15210 [Gammaproteobacteria bacterium]|nr:MAG: hypothetical protein DRR06_15210 [Gammaproteobacteria bacterium]